MKLNIPQNEMIGLIKQFFTYFPPFEKENKKSLSNCNYIVVGGAAIHLYFPKRNISDLDMILISESLLEFSEKLQKAGINENCKRIVDIQDLHDGFIFGSFISSHKEIKTEITKNSSIRDFYGIDVCVASPELLIASKLGSKYNLEGTLREKDVAGIKLLNQLDINTEKLNSLFKYTNIQAEPKAVYFAFTKGRELEKDNKKIGISMLKLTKLTAKVLSYFGGESWEGIHQSMSDYIRKFGFNKLQYELIELYRTFKILNDKEACQKLFDGRIINPTYKND